MGILKAITGFVVIVSLILLINLHSLLVNIMI